LRQKHTDFFYKLDELKDRIEVYNDMFRSNVPSFMRKAQKRKVVHIFSLNFTFRRTSKEINHFSSLIKSIRNKPNLAKYKPMMI
jgi:hypothetical protein